MLEHHKARPDIRNITNRSGGQRNVDDNLYVIGVAVSHGGDDAAATRLPTGMVRHALCWPELEARLVLVSANTNGLREGQCDCVLSISQPRGGNKRPKTAETRLWEQLS